MGRMNFREKAEEIKFKVAGPLEILLGVASAGVGTYFLFGADDLGPGKYFLSAMSYLLALGCVVDGIRHSSFMGSFYGEIHKRLDSENSSR
jgi:hypothetical protein